MIVCLHTKSRFEIALCVIFVIASLQSLTWGQVYSRGYDEEADTAEIIEKISEYPKDGGLFLKLRKRIREETDSKQRQQALAVYALGAMLRGHLRAGDSARRILLKEYPNSEYSRTLRLNNLGMECPVCGGEGRIGRECPDCNGTGNCTMCDGKGTVSMKLSEGESIQCPKCGGTGACGRCEGSGQIYRQCHRCKGRGMIFSRKSVKQVYDAVLQGNPAILNNSDRDPATNRHQTDADERKGNLEHNDSERDDEDVLKYF